jgi:hypothetical protein
MFSFPFLLASTEVYTRRCGGLFPAPATHARDECRGAGRSAVQRAGRRRQLLMAAVDIEVHGEALLISLVKRDV